MKVSRIVQENIAYMNELLPVQESYDIVEIVFLVFSIYPKDCIFFHFFLISAPRKPGSLQQ